MTQDLNYGDRVQVRAYRSRVFKRIKSRPVPEQGLTYPAFSGILLDDAGASEGWDVVEVEPDNGGEPISIYCFSIIREPAKI